MLHYKLMILLLRVNMTLATSKTEWMERNVLLNHNSLGYQEKKSAAATSWVTLSG